MSHEPIYGQTSRATKTAKSEEAAAPKQLHDHSHVDRTWANGQSPARTKVENLVELLGSQLDACESRLAASTPMLDEHEIDVIRDALQTERGSLNTALTELPPGSAVMKAAFAVSDRVTATVAKLDALSRAYAAHARTSTAPTAGDEAQDAFAQANTIAPAGFCDSAVQGSAPCNLDFVTRDRYRRRVMDLVQEAATNWGLALIRVDLDRRLTKENRSIEQMLGQLVLDSLFGIMGAAVTAVVHHGIEKHVNGSGKGKPLEAREEVYLDKPPTVSAFLKPADRGGGSPTSSALHTQDEKELAGKVVDKTFEAGKAKTEGMSAERLAKNAIVASQQSLEADGFLQSLKGAPQKWKGTIDKDIDQLFDADLASLVVAVSNADISVAGFEAKINALLKRFDQQVAPIARTSVRPIQVVPMRGPIRRALVAEEMKPNPHLHGEWKSADTWSGKWSLVTLIDDDMETLAVGAASQIDPAANSTMRAASDASYWDEKSLQLLSERLGG